MYYKLPTRGITTIEAKEVLASSSSCTLPQNSSILALRTALHNSHTHPCVAVENRVLPQHPPFCTMSVGCYSNTPRVLVAPFRVLKHIKHPGGVTVTPQGVAAQFRVQDAAVKHYNSTALSSLGSFQVWIKLCSFESILGRFSTSTATY